MSSRRGSGAATPKNASDSSISRLEDNVENRLKVFARKFSQYFVQTLKDKHKIALKEAKAEAGKTEKALGKAVGAGLGAGLGVLTGVFGIMGGVKGGMMLGGMVAEKLGQKKAQEKAGNVNKLMGDQLNVEGFKSQVVDMAVEIFKMYEEQMVRVTSKKGWSVAMVEMARDAVERIFEHLSCLKISPNEMNKDQVLRGVLDGSSKGILGKGESVVDKTSEASWPLLTCSHCLGS